MLAHVIINQQKNIAKKICVAANETCHESLHFCLSSVRLVGMNSQPQTCIYVYAEAENKKLYKKPFVVYKFCIYLLHLTLPIRLRKANASPNYNFNGPKNRAAASKPTKWRTHKV